MLILLAIFGCVPTGQPVPDADHDGVSADVDCDDSEADAFPGAIEFCDGIDNDCNGLVDDEAIDASPWYRDEDADRFGADSVLACEPPEGFVEVGGDCDDTRPDIRPLRTEICDGVDNNCDGRVDIDPDIPFFPDADGDGWGDAASPQRTCSPDPGWVSDGRDCDDSNAEVHPSGAEVCDGVDNNCDGLVDDADPQLQDPTDWYPDTDADGYGTADFSVQSCLPPPGSWSLSDQDCNDFVSGIAPGAVEYCNHIDDDCDGVVDSADALLVSGPRAALSLSAVDPLFAPVFVERVDLQALFTASGGVGDVDPDALRVGLGTCGAGLSDLPVRFLDDLDDLDTPGVDGDLQGALVVLSGDLAAGEQRSGWLYFSASPGVGSASATSSSLGSGVALASFDAGLLLTDLGPAGNLSQLGVRPRVDTPAGSLGWESAATVEVDSHPAVSRVHASGEQSNGAGGVAWEADWLMVSGRPELHGSLRIEAVADTTLSAPGGWRNAVVGFAAQVDGDPVQVGADWIYQGSSDSALVRLIDGGAAQPEAVQGSFQLRGTAAPGPGPSEDTAVIPAGEVLGESTFLLLSELGPDAAGRVGELDAVGALELQPWAP